MTWRVTLVLGDSWIEAAVMNLVQFAPYYWQSCQRCPNNLVPVGFCQRHHHLQSGSQSNPLIFRRTLNHHQCSWRDRFSGTCLALINFCSSPPRVIVNYLLQSRTEQFWQPKSLYQSKLCICSTISLFNLSGVFLHVDKMYFSQSADCISQTFRTYLLRVIVNCPFQSGAEEFWQWGSLFISRLRQWITNHRFLHIK